MRTSIATVSLAGSLEEKLVAIAAAGFDGVEIFENDLIASPLTPREVGRLAADLGVSIELYQPFRDLEGVAEPQFAANLRRAAAKLDIAAELGAPVLLLCSNVATAEFDDDVLAAEQLHRLGDLARERGVAVAYEALAWGRFVSTYEHAWSIVQAAGHPSIGLCLDSFHMLSRDAPLGPIANIPGDRILFVQVADAPALQLDPLSLSRHHRLFPGQGSFDLVAWTSAIAATGYAGPLSIEVFNDVFRQTDPRRTAVDGLRSLRYLEDLAALSTGGGAASLTPLTVGGGAQDVDYIHLAVSARHALDATLEALGFVAGGTAGDADVWVQGDVRLLVTTAGWGPSSRLGIVGLGFRTSDVEASARRAAELLAPALPSEFDASGRTLTSPEPVRIGLTPALEFPVVSHGGLIDRVDHVSLPQDWRTFDETVLLFRSVLGLDARPSEDVPDERGLVRSQVLVNDSGSVRVVLNVLPANLDSSAAARSPGHIALASRDIVAMVRSLALLGVPTLRLPANYYDDLQVRFELDPEFVAELQASHLMYDRNADGEFLQAYTETRDDVFFEIVERRGGYASFGAGNSPVRRAAQRRTG